MAAAPPQKTLTPHFEWCQDMDRLLIRINLSADVDATKLDITRDTFSFSFKNYELKFSFRFPVNPKTIKYRSTRTLELIIEKETTNAYWPHLLPQTDKKRLKNQCKVDWNRFMDEEEAQKRQKGVVDDDDGYGNLGGMGGMPGMGGMGGMGAMGNMLGGDDSSSDDSDDKPIDDLEINDADDLKKDDTTTNTDNEKAKTKDAEEEEEEDAKKGNTQSNDNQNDELDID